MAAKKPDKHRRKQDQRPKRLFKRRPGPAIPPGYKVVYEPPGHAKMSEVLEDFIEPYERFCKDDDAYRKTLSLAVLAWNAALSPPDARQEMIELVLGTGLPDGSAQDRAMARQMVEALIRRKLEHFADNQRMIISFDLQDTGSGLHLSVASTL